MKNEIELTKENNKEEKVHKRLVERIIDAFKQAYAFGNIDDGEIVYFYRGH